MIDFKALSIVFACSVVAFVCLLVVINLLFKLMHRWRKNT